jgi:hypothetical protein
MFCSICKINFNEILICARCSKLMCNICFNRTTNISVPDWRNYSIKLNKYQVEKNLLDTEDIEYCFCNKCVWK